MGCSLSMNRACTTASDASSVAGPVSVIGVCGIVVSSLVSEVPWVSMQVPIAWHELSASLIVSASTTITQ